MTQGQSLPGCEPAERSLGPSDLSRFVSSAGIRADLIRFETPTTTVDESARAAGVSPEQIIKSIVFLVDGAPRLVVVNGNARIDYKRLASVWRTNRRRIRMASPQDVLRITGYEVGGVPPFGFRQDLPALIDRKVLAQDVVIGGGGDGHTLMRISSGDLVAVTRAQVQDLLFPAV
jgi:Cys-tRNA(Pro) deacylase